MAAGRDQQQAETAGAYRCGSGLSSSAIEAAALAAPPASTGRSAARTATVDEMSSRTHASDKPASVPPPGARGDNSLGTDLGDGYRAPHGDSGWLKELVEASHKPA